MNNPYRLITPSPGWARLLWRGGQQHQLDAKLALSLLEPVPGIQLSETYIDVPHTAWMLEGWEALLDSCGIAETQWPDGLAAPEFDAAWKPAREPYAFQQVAIDFARAEGVALIADDMGLGKTTEAAIAAESIRRVTDGSVVIVAPLIVRGSWRQELHAIGAISDDSQFCALESRDSRHDSFRRSGVRYYFVHYDVARAWWSQLNALGARRPCVAILDEAHWVRNGRTQRARGANMLAGTCKYRFLLTGTPLDNRTSDLWHPLTITTGARTWGGPLDFRRRYAGAVYNGYGWTDGDEATNVTELQDRMAPFYLRRTAEAVGLELPALTRQSVRVNLTAALRREHDAVLQGSSIEAIVRAVSCGAVEEVLPTLTRLRQITSRAKLDFTVELVHNALDQGQSPVVFCWEQDTVHSLVGRIEGHSLAIDGSMPQSDREAKVRRFQEESRPFALVATLASLREGVTLHRSRMVILHDLHWVLNHLLQAEKRVHRIGQAWPCQSLWVIADNSIDTILAPVLLRKAALSKELLGIDAGADAIADLDLAEVAGADAVEEQVELALQAWRMS